MCDSDVSEMMNKGIPRPNIAFFSSIVHSLCKEGRVMDAHHIFDLVKDIGERPDIIMFNTLIDGYCLVGEMGKAFMVLDVMTSAGIEPDAITYSTLVSGYCKSGRIDDGLILFREMLHKKCYI
ncbi:hypothetical protein CFC21_005502 [Triticum aestivum]|uniref:Pentatricopeptide repeat-containing protein n=2 Tax=Triticum aestivum TaxID=4565 RepID=A0A9R1IP97_WHEAT|nr:hypothetical protein CFC21_005502 [Triticum aestivum]